MAFLAQNGYFRPKNGHFLTFRTQNLGSERALDEFPSLTELFYREKPQKPPHDGEIGHHARTLKYNELQTQKATIALRIQHLYGL